jgi:prepilin-type N-terminal cleavage/methylation domain-containing protein/prepilin-type processing-associated H-X9-DG protein
MDSHRRGFTLIELLAVVVLLFVLVAALLPTPHRVKPKAKLVICMNNLKQDALALRIWAEDHQDKYPMAVPTELEGTKEFATGAETYRHYLVMSNELCTPGILVCPDDTRTNATVFANFNNQHLSYFINLDANPKAPRMFLAGDRHLTSTNPPVSGVLNLSPGQKLGWTDQLHKVGGNVAFTDGHVSFCRDANVTEALRISGNATNVWRISLPE